METAKVLKFPKKLCVYLKSRTFARFLYIALCSIMQDIKQHIISIAAPRMKQVGIRSVSIDDLCHELGISKKTFYVYFPSKEDLLEAILAVQLELLTRDMRNLIAKKSITHCIIDWALIAKKTEEKAHQAPPMLYDLQKYYPHIYKSHMKNMRAVMREFVSQFIVKGQQEGIFRHEIDVANTALIFVHTHKMITEYSQAHEYTHAQTHQLAKTSIDILLRGIFTSEGLESIKKMVNN